MNTSPDHPDFTALALGEHIHGAPAQAVLEALRTSVTARREAEEICTTARQLSFMLKGQPPLRLDSARRSAILNADPAAIRARFAEEDRIAAVAAPPAPVVRPSRTWVYPTIAAAAVAVAAVMVLKLLPGYSTPSRAGKPPVADAADGDPLPNGKILVTPVQPRSRESTPPPSRRPRAPEVVNKPSGTVGAPVRGPELPLPVQPPAMVKESPPVPPPLPVPASRPQPVPSGAPPGADRGLLDYTAPPSKKAGK